ncbi:MAG TPA: hypothetical protein VGR62_13510 [Candidatus Binatia bacterium]|jgi:hypothetical protein|nr:hypothetical protein [Candidatus Binatia bacterium]
MSGSIDTKTSFCVAPRDLMVSFCPATPLSAPSAVGGNHASRKATVIDRRMSRSPNARGYPLARPDGKIRSRVAGQRRYGASPDLDQ